MYIINLKYVMKMYNIQPCQWNVTTDKKCVIKCFQSVPADLSFVGLYGTKMFFFLPFLKNLWVNLYFKIRLYEKADNRIRLLMSVEHQLPG